MHVIFVNGPPGSGKDTAAQILQEFARFNDDFYDVYNMKFATPLKDAAHALFGLSIGTSHFEEAKDDLLPQFFGFSPRQVYIKLSEDFVKPNFGRQFFGLVALQQLKAVEALGSSNVMAVFSDCGFIDEILPVVRAMNSVHDSAFLIRLHRPGHDFAKDSRSHIMTDFSFPSVDVHNIGTLSEFQHKIEEVYKQWLFQVQTRSMQNSNNAAVGLDSTLLLAGTEASTPKSQS